MNNNPIEYLIARETAYIARALASVLIEAEDLGKRKTLRSHYLNSLENATRELRDALLKIEALKEAQP